MIPQFGRQSRYTQWKDLVSSVALVVATVCFPLFVTIVTTQKAGSHTDTSSAALRKLVAGNSLVFSCSHHNTGGGGGGGGGLAVSVQHAVGGPVYSVEQVRNVVPQSGSGPSNIVCGAVQSVAPHPLNSSICFAGAANGGVFRTMDCTSDIPTWQALTEQLPTNSIADVRFDSASPDVLIAAVGRRSSLGRAGGLAAGLYLCENALDEDPTWTILDNGGDNNDNSTTRVNFTSMYFSSVYKNGSLILAGAEVFRSQLVDNLCDALGVWRSTDNGLSFENVLPGRVFDLQVDPNNDSLVYVIGRNFRECDIRSNNNSESNFTTDRGVKLSMDRGATWLDTTFPSVAGVAQDIGNGKITIGQDGRVWASLIFQGTTAVIAYSDDVMTSWTAMDRILIPGDTDTGDGLHPRNGTETFSDKEEDGRLMSSEDMKAAHQLNDGRAQEETKTDDAYGGQGMLHFSMLVSPTDSNEVYVGGDRQSLDEDDETNILGATMFSARLFRGHANVAPTGGNPSPQWAHMTDNRGVNRPGLSNGGTASSTAPHADSRDMEMRPDGVLLEADDGGLYVRTSPTDNAGDWYSLCGDMQVFETHNVAYEPVLGTVAFGNQDTSNFIGTLGEGDFRSISGGDGNDVMIDYKSSPFFVYYYVGSQNLGTFFRQAVSKKHGGFGRPRPVQMFRYSGYFISKMAMNPNFQRQYAIAANRDGGFLENYIVWTYTRGRRYYSGEFPNPTAYLGALAFENRKRIFVAAFLTDINARHNQLYSCRLRFWLLIGTMRCETVGPAFGRFTVVDQLVLDPLNENIMYAYGQAGPFVFSSATYWVFDGSRWHDMALDELASNPLAGAIAVAAVGDGRSVVLVANSDGLWAPNGQPGTEDHTEWNLIADGLPNVPVSDMIYDATDDLVVIGTFGRGVYFVDGIRSLLRSDGRRSLRKASQQHQRRRPKKAVQLDWSSQHQHEYLHNDHRSPPRHAWRRSLPLLTGSTPDFE